MARGGMQGTLSGVVEGEKKRDGFIGNSGEFT